MVDLVIASGPNQSTLGAYAGLPRHCAPRNDGGWRDLTRQLRARRAQRNKTMESTWKKHDNIPL